MFLSIMYIGLGEHIRFKVLNHMRNYENLIIWKSSIQFVKKIYSLIHELPNTEKFGLNTQITRAAVSIPSNIAEGCSRSSKKDFNRFLEFALGSAFELQTQLIIIKESFTVENQNVDHLISELLVLQKQINSFKQKIKPEATC